MTGQRNDVYINIKLYLWIEEVVSLFKVRQGPYKERREKPEVVKGVR
jgi:hypothetical protein